MKPRHYVLQYDSVRINQIYEQAKWSVITERVQCTDEEMTLFAGLQVRHQFYLASIFRPIYVCVCVEGNEPTKRCRFPGLHRTVPGYIKSKIRTCIGPRRERTKRTLAAYRINVRKKTGKT